MNPKQEAQTTHKIAALSYLMVDTLEDFKRNVNKQT